MDRGDYLEFFICGVFVGKNQTVGGSSGSEAMYEIKLTPLWVVPAHVYMPSVQSRILDDTYRMVQ